MILTLEERESLRVFCDTFQLAKKVDNWPQFVEVLLRTDDNEQEFFSDSSSSLKLFEILREVTRRDAFIQLCLSDIRAVKKRIEIAIQSTGTSESESVQAQLEKQKINCVNLVKYIVANIYL